MITIGYKADELRLIENSLLNLHNDMKLGGPVSYHQHKAIADLAGDIRSVIEDLDKAKFYVDDSTSKPDVEDTAHGK